MVSGINSNVNSLQILRATQAFKTAIQSSPKVNSVLDESAGNVEDKVSLTSKATEKVQNVGSKVSESPIISKNKEYINDIKQFANQQWNTQINDEDIDYALRYGRSILIDQVV